MFSVLRQWKWSRLPTSPRPSHRGMIYVVYHHVIDGGYVFSNVKLARASVCVCVWPSYRWMIYALYDHVTDEGYVFSHVRLARECVFVCVYVCERATNGWYMHCMIIWLMEDMYSHMLDLRASMCVCMCVCVSELQMDNICIVWSCDWWTICILTC